jgi:hypothetical protein
MSIARQFITDLQADQRIGNVSSETEQHLNPIFSEGFCHASRHRRGWEHGISFPSLGCHATEG